MKIFSNTKGFTLIELLVVISIIGLLSSLAVVSLNSARIKARDALRRADMSQMRTALNLYYMDHNAYPICGAYDGSAQPYGATVGNNSADGSEDGSWCYINDDPNLAKGLNFVLTTGAKPYIQEIPRDPRNKDNIPFVSQGVGDNTYIYRYASNGSEYVLAYTLEEGDITEREKFIRGW